MGECWERDDRLTEGGQTQAVANLLNGFASVRWDDDEVVTHLSKAAVLEGKGAFTPPEVAMSLQALAVLYLPGDVCVTARLAALCPGARRGGSHMPAIV